MNLSRKTFVYSSIISVIIVSLIVAYFILMLPSLYVAYMQDRNYASIVELQKGFMKAGSYENLEVKNPTGTITLDIPMSGSSFYIISKFFRIKVDVRNGDIQKVLDKLRYYATHKDVIKDLSEADFNLEDIGDKLLADSRLWNNYPLEFELELYQYNNTFQEISSRLHPESEDMMVYEANVTDGYNFYTSYIAMGLTDQAISISFLPVMTPRIDEISPVIFQSLPMIVAVALLLVLVSSQVFSRVIILTVVRLAKHAEYMKDAKNLKLEPVAITGRDEISSLGESLNKLYQKIQESYQELEVKNQYLSEENERQEVFLRASSHQLKTPITAALLLVQGMIGEVGKYKDVMVYLPQVKQQLQSMQKIVEDILYLNHCSRDLQMEQLSLSELVEECIKSYHVQLEQKRLDIAIEGQGPLIVTDRELLKKILDNLLSNAVYFTPEGGRIKISSEERKLRIINYGITIDDELLPHVFEPFVTSVNKNKGHGLGLYVVSYYARLLQLQVKLYNIEQGVMAELIS